MCAQIMCQRPAASASDDLVQTVDYARNVLLRCSRDAPADSFGCERPDLTDLDPGSLCKALRTRLERQRESGRGLQDSDFEGIPGVEYRRRRGSAHGTVVVCAHRPRGS